MTLVRSRPVQGTRPARDDLFDSFDRLFDRMARPGLAADAGTYPMDLYETDDALMLEMPVPGMNPEDLDLSLEGRHLTIRGTIPESGAADRRYWLQGVPRGEVTRSVNLPIRVDADAIHARVQHGLLVLTLPKAQEAKVRKIAVEAE